MVRIRTTHTGSLPRPDDLAELILRREEGEMAPGLDQRVVTAVADVVRRQAETGIDIVNDGEIGRLGYATYIKDRLRGFDGEDDQVGFTNTDVAEHPEFAARDAARKPPRHLPACTSDLRPKDPEGVQRDIRLLKEAARASGARELFMTAASPGVISIFFQDHHYGDRSAYLHGLADAMRPEYEAIAGAGITLQLDCPDLAMGRHARFGSLTLEEFKREARLGVEALNDAVRNIPAERLRMHLCWGNYEGPHHHDVPLRELIEIVLDAKPAGLVLEASNPRHGHEWAVFEDVPLPEGKYLVPGVIDSTCNYIEHPELVAQRIRNYTRLVGDDRVVAGTDCGFGTSVVRQWRVVPSITWAKLGSLVEGAHIASTQPA